MPSSTKEAILQRIDERLQSTGKTDRGAALEAGLGADAIRDLRRKGKTMPTLDTLEKLAPVLDTTPEYLAFAKRSRTFRGRAAPAMPIKGEVAAGLWLEIDASDEPEFEDVAVAFDPKWPQEAQYGLIVRGTSVNRVARPGDVLQCVDIGISGVGAQDGDMVIVERRRAQAGQKEVTAKRFHRRGKVVELIPDSTDPRWKDSLILDPRKAPEGEEIAVIAVVIGVYNQLKRR